MEKKNDTAVNTLPFTQNWLSLIPLKHFHSLLVSRVCCNVLKERKKKTNLNDKLKRFAMNPESTRFQK